MPYKDRKKQLRYGRNYYYKNRERLCAQGRKHRKEFRIKILSYYCGGKPPFCSCCGESYVEFLSLDHINGGGTQQRKTIKGTAFYYWVVKHNYPPGLRVLCHNCNQSYGFYGYCPHKR